MWLRRGHICVACIVGCSPRSCLFIAAVWRGDCTESGIGERRCIEVALVRRRWERVFARRGVGSVAGRARRRGHTASCGGRERRVRLRGGGGGARLSALAHFFACGVVCDGRGGGWSRRNRGECGVGGLVLECGRASLRVLRWLHPRAPIASAAACMCAWCIILCWLRYKWHRALTCKAGLRSFGQKRGEQCWRPPAASATLPPGVRRPGQLHVSRGFGD